MRSESKKKAMVFIIILIFSFSSLAYVVNFFRGEGTEKKTYIPENFILDGELQDDLLYQYIKNGYTSVKLFYKNNNSDIFLYVEKLPNAYKIHDRYYQIILQKIPSNLTYVNITSIRGSVEIKNVTKENIFSSLCRLLVYPPVECGLNATLLKI